MNTLSDTSLQLLVMQSAFNTDCNTIIELIAPIVCNKKITKREIDKANKVILDTFGTYDAYTNEQGEIVKYPRYTVALYTDYSKTLKIYKHDRSFTKGERGYYMHESDKHIYLDDGMITTERIKQFIYDKKYMPTEKQIIQAYNQYVKYEEQIGKLNNKKSDLPFHYYFNK